MLTVTYLRYFISIYIKINKMKIPKQMKERMTEYYSHGDQSRIKRFASLSKNYSVSLPTINKAFKQGECSDELLDIILEFYNQKHLKYAI